MAAADTHQQAMRFVRDTIAGLEELVHRVKEDDDPHLAPMVESFLPLLDGIVGFRETLKELAPLAEERRASWESLLDEHPELFVDVGGRPVTDNEVLEALARALDNKLWPGAAEACEVARLIYGADEFGPLHGYSRRARVGRVAQRLGRLGRSGRVVRLRPRYGSSRCLWSLPGVRISKRALLQHEVS
jgi:hypothetical protein